MKVAYIAAVDHPELLKIQEYAVAQKVMAVDLEGDLSSNGKMSLMQVAFGGGDKAYVLDVYKCPQLLKHGTISLLLENPDIMKVVHACSNDARALKGQFNISLQSVFDTQVAHYILSGKDPSQAQAGMNVVLSTYAGKENTQKDKVVHRNGLWEQRPLPPNLLDYAAQDVVHLVAVFRKMKRMANVQKQLFTTILKLSMERVPKKPAELLKATVQEFWIYLTETNAHRDIEGLPQAFDHWKRTRGQSCKGGRKKVLQRIEQKMRTHSQRNTAAQVAISNLVVNAAESKAAVLKAVQRVERSRKSLEATKGGVEISRVIQRDVIPVGQRVTERLTVHNGSKLTRQLRSIKLLRTDRHDITVTHAQVQFPLALAPASTFNVELHFAPTFTGVHCNTLTFAFDTFSISRFLEIRCGDASLLDDLKPTTPYRRPNANGTRPPGKGIAAPRSNVGKRDKTWIPVPPSKIPAGFTHQLELGEMEDVLEEAKAVLEGADREAALQRHRFFWQNLLWAEEAQLTRDLATFNLTGDKATVLSKRGESELELAVAGLAENRPSVIRGDIVRARLCGPGHADSQVWEGVATYIHREDVGLRFNPGFHKLYRPGQRVEIFFVLSRMPLQICHQGLQLARSLHPDVLFPRPPASFREPRGGIKDFEPVNKQVGQNPQQRLAVLSILQGACRPVPYILFGPPGTGKTTTLVEAIIQCMRCKGMPTGLRVLVCAPTNTAADVICERLAPPLGTVDSPAEMLRLMAYSRSPDQVPPAIRRFTITDQLGAFAMPTRQELESRRIVVASLAMAGKLHNAGMERGHFDIIFIDEAGQAVEPEALAPVAALLGAEGQLVLAGDVKQLGPVIHSDLAKTCGLQTSFMERLMEREVYAKHASQFQNTHGYDPRVLTKLDWNFRSHPALLELPNSLFYDGELLAKADARTVNNCLQWPGLLNAKVPMVFEGVEGEDQREASSPSWFNADEAVLVLRYVESLLRAQLPLRIQPSDIGVITPYNKQVHKIQRLLRAESYGDVKVGSTEMFQGSEKRVIIISTVRSSRDFITWDKQHKLGFLDNPKRFNVAVTRAACLMIVVGNPMVLVGDACWGALLRQCVAQGLYRGVPLPDLSRVGQDTTAGAQEQAELLEALEGMFLDEAEGDEGRASEMITQEAASMPEHDL